MDDAFKKRIEETVKKFHYCPKSLLEEILDYIEKLENPTHTDTCEALRVMVSKDILLPTRPQVEQLINLVNELSEKVKALENPLQPIETAPKDGTRILGYDKENKYHYLMSYEYGKWHSVTWVCVQPTHWMPLPKLGVA